MINKNLIQTFRFVCKDCWNQPKVNKTRHYWRQWRRYFGMLVKKQKLSSHCPVKCHSSHTVIHIFKIQWRKKYEIWINSRFNYIFSVQCLFAAISVRVNEARGFGDLPETFLIFRECLSNWIFSYFQINSFDFKFTDEGGAGALLFLYSAVMTRTTSK